MANEESATNAPIDLTLVQNGGVLKEIITPGTCDESPSEGCKVFVHYTGTLLDGTKFDSSVDRGEKFSFNLGKGQVIKAWDLGVASMKRGEKCKLTCKPEFAYGEKGSPPTIPANATLVFEIELFDWEFEDVSPDSDKSITRQVLKEGKLYETPNDGANVSIDIKGSYGDTVFDERSLKFNINEDECENIPKPVEDSIKKMKKDETSLFRVNSKHAFGSEGHEGLGVPKDTDVNYEIHLKNFEKAKESWEMSDEEKVEQGEIIKAKGTTFFKEGQLNKAIIQYKKIKDLLDYREDAKKSELDEKWNSLKLAAHLNLALCYIKVKNFEEATKCCDTAIEIDNNSEKAFFRRGESEFARENYENAKSDFTQAKNLNPANKLAIKRIREANAQIHKIKEKEKKLFGGMFEKFARQDEKQELRRKQAVKEAKKAKADEKPDTEASGDAKEEQNGIEVDETPSEVKVNGD
uniref:peptidyl-prolyl cis-trans isomerase FKBP4-like n=1 Tax=Styela clava TaxID=7725 RepID=UPI00193A0905|nr:peptidyl-prolyl cis-trans isomerase FKBP4-like [Styela clava]